MAGEIEGFQIRSCRRCKTLFTSELPSTGQATDYAGYYHPRNLEVPALVRRRLGELAASLGARRRLNRWLDVGCGAGTLLEAAKAEGWDVVGTEVSEGAAEAVRGRGFDVRVGELGDLALPAGGFDVVSMIEVIEHVAEPDALLANAAALLRPGGALYVTTPHGRGLSARLLGTDWSVVAPPEHLQLLSVRGLRAVLERSGLTERELHTHAVNPRELIASLRPGDRDAQQETAGNRRVDSGYRLNETLSSTRGGALFKRAANAALDAARLGDSLKAVAERPG